MLAVALLLVGAGVGVHVEDARGVSPEESGAVAALLAEVIAARTGEPGSVLDARASGTDIVLLRLLGVPTRIRVLAERPGEPPVRAEADLQRTNEGWRAALEPIAAALFPEPSQPPPAEPAPDVQVAPIVETAPPAVEATLYWPPWALVGAGVALGAVGAGFGLSSRSARDEAASRPHTEAELDALEDRAIGHGLAANLLFGAAVAGVAGGVVWLLLEE